MWLIRVLFSWVEFLKEGAKKIWTWRRCRTPVQPCWRRTQGSTLCNDWRCFNISGWLFSCFRFGKLPKDIQYADNWCLWDKQVIKDYPELPLYPGNTIANVCLSLWEIELSWALVGIGWNGVRCILPAVEKLQKLLLMVPANICEAERSFTLISLRRLKYGCVLQLAQPGESRISLPPEFLKKNFGAG